MRDFVLLRRGLRVLSNSKVTSNSARNLFVDSDVEEDLPDHVVVGWILSWARMDNFVDGQFWHARGVARFWKWCAKRDSRV